MVYLSVTPLQAISSKTQQLIENLLNPPKVIPTSNGLLRDWRGFAHECKVAVETFAALRSHTNPIGDIIKILQTSQDFTLKDLNDTLEKIERFDVIEELEPYLCEDAEEYQINVERSKNSAEKNDVSREAEVLTLDDIYRINRGEKPQHYDAFLLYANEDETIALKLIDYLENQNNFKLFIKERDLAVGILSETGAIMRLISERCNKVIAIISPSFLKSNTNDYLLNFALACGIEKRDGKIIPFIYETCELPLPVQYSAKIHYSENSNSFAWQRLVDSLRPLNRSSDVKQAESKKELEFKAESEAKCVDSKKQDSSCYRKEVEEKPLKTEKSSKKMPMFDPLKNLLMKRKKPSNAICDSDIVKKLPTVDSLESLESSPNSLEKKKKKKINFFKKCELLAQ